MTRRLRLVAALALTLSGLAVGAGETPGGAEPAQPSPPPPPPDTEAFVAGDPSAYDPLAVAATEGGEGFGAAADPLPPPHVTTGPPVGVVQSEQNMGVIPWDSDVASRDGGTSVALGGTSVWAFGDTVVRNQARNFLSNTAASTTDLDASNGITLGPEVENPPGTIVEAIPWSPWENFFNYYNDPVRCTPNPEAPDDCGKQYFIWPGAGFADPANNRMVFMFRIGLRGGEAGEGFSTGWSIAYRSATGAWTRPEVAPSHPWDKWTMSAAPDIFGMPIVHGSDVYVHRCQLDFVSSLCNLARAPISQFADMSTWRYYVGNDASGNPQWSTDIHDPAIVTVVRVGAFWASAYYNTHLQRFMIVSGNGDGAGYNTAPNPWGPWSDTAFLFDGVDPEPHPVAGCGTVANYAAQAHPEYGSGADLYVSYTRVSGWGPGFGCGGYGGLQELMLQKVTFAPANQALYRNPGIHGTSPDPSIIRSVPTASDPDAKYYSATNGYRVDAYALDVRVPARVSTDLVKWTGIADLLPQKPAWADGNGSTYSSPHIHQIAGNPAPSKYLLYFTGTHATSGEKCIGVAVSSVARGPYTPQAQPLICGGVQDPSLAPSIAGVYQQLVYRKNGTDPGIYRQFLAEDGQSIAPSSPPRRIYVAQAGGWQQGLVDQPSVTFNSGNIYLFFSAGPRDTANRAVGWSPCVKAFGLLLDHCLNPPPGAASPLIASGTQSVAPSSAQPFTDGTHKWFVYSSRQVGGCTTSGCTKPAELSIDKLCFANGAPRTNAPTRTVQTLTRSTNCAVDVP